MRLDDLRLFTHLADSLHYTRTAEECHVTPSTLSRVITRLEADTGVRLFERDRRSVQLTPDGVRFRTFAEVVTEQWTRFAAASDSADAVAGDVAIYCTVTASQSVLPQILAVFRQQYPRVQLHIQTGDAAAALDALADGTVDVTVAALGERRPRGVIAHTLTTTDVVPVVSPASGLDISMPPSAAWSTLPWVLPSEGLVRTLVDGWFRRLRVRPRVAAEATGHEAVLALVALGCGVGVVPRIVADKSPLAASLSVVDPGPSAPHFDVAACTVPERFSNRAVAALWRTLGADRR